MVFSNSNSPLYGQSLASQMNASQAAMNASQAAMNDQYNTMNCTGIEEGLVNQPMRQTTSIETAARAAPHADEADDELAKELAGRSGVLATATVPHPDVEGGVPLWKLFRPQATATLDRINPKRVELYEEKRQLELMNQRAAAARAIQNQQLNSLASYQTASTNWRNVYSELEQAMQSDAIPHRDRVLYDKAETPEEKESIVERLKSFITRGRGR
jgi:hypothetical protein